MHINKQYIETNENSLTSFVFERLSYLPSELFEHIIRDSINDELPPIDFKTREEIIFWPHWNSENTGNSQYVEPDVFLRFEKYDILIEAKRRDEKQQYTEQWEKEIQAYQNEYSDDNKTLIFIALGGINNNQSELCKEYKIYKCKWTSILNTIRNVKKKIEPTAALLNSNFAINVILDDLISIFQIFGYSTADWFEVFDYESGINDSSIDTFVELNSRCPIAG